MLIINCHQQGRHLIIRYCSICKTFNNICNLFFGEYSSISLFEDYVIHSHQTPPIFVLFINSETMTYLTYLQKTPLFHSICPILIYPKNFYYHSYNYYNIILTYLYIIIFTFFIDCVKVQPCYIGVYHLLSFIFEHLILLYNTLK